MSHMNVKRRYSSANQRYFYKEGNQIFNGSFNESLGGGTVQEDAASAVGEIFGPNTQYYAMFDGHGGNNVSQYLAKHLHEKIREQYNILKDSKSIEEIIQTSITEVNSMLIEQYPATGSTVALTLIIGKRAHFANIGDTRIVLIEDGVAKRITVDHNVNNGDEITLLQRRGGSFFNGRVSGVLSLTRCLGDGTYIGSLSTEISYLECDIRDGMHMIMACDGVWDVMSDEDAVELYMKTGDPSTAAKAIVEESLKRGSCDNISVICVSLTPKLI